MPSEKVLEMKKQQVADLKARFEGACAGVLVDYKGISVADDTVLRKELREAGVQYTVSKNTLLHLAFAGFHPPSSCASDAHLSHRRSSITLRLLLSSHSAVHSF